MRHVALRPFAAPGIGVIAPGELAELALREGLQRAHRSARLHGLWRELQCREVLKQGRTRHDDRRRFVGPCAGQRGRHGGLLIFRACLVRAQTTVGLQSRPA